MNRKNINRKTLSIVLCLVVVSVLTLTIAYAALNAVLTIQGNARVSAADWDIYLNNPRVTNGSATANLPVIKTSSTLEFETTLNMPGDFYEFVVDVVNGGDIDAMIENVVKTPNLTEEQAKFLKYEVTYENGEPITTKQTLSKGTTTPIKVRIEYRKDLTSTDLPTSQTVLDMSITLEYTQSDGTGTTIPNNGLELISVIGDIDEFGTQVRIGSEYFYVIGTEENNVKLFAKYNLHVGGIYDDTNEHRDIVNPTGMQDSSARGWFEEYNEDNPIVGYVWENADDFNLYLTNYKTKLKEKFNVDIVESRLITYDEMKEKNTFNCADYGGCSTNYPWIYYTSFYTSSEMPGGGQLWRLMSNNKFGNFESTSGCTFGIRPVVVISKDYFN